MDNHDKESDMLKVLKEDWENIDAIAGTPQITQHEIHEQLHSYKLKRKRAFRKELYLFILTAIFILGLFITIIFKSRETILFIQVCACLIGPVIYLFLTKREGKVRL
ncbi:hypothetical protein CJ195_00815 [Bacillus sp. UMB0899]|uniref:YxlC family protein n=1 Tax=Metabacillus schmidteae TaxID=2730405 RepID=UPI000C804664|nr:hypothetical protein CJ195_00815 [Bacillus sp. UMB0899]